MEKLLNMIAAIFGVSWKTTLFGWLASVTGVSMVGWFKDDGKPNYGVIGVALLFALFARFTRDDHPNAVTPPTAAPVVYPKPVVPPTV